MAKKELKPIRESRVIERSLRRKIQKFLFDNLYAQLLKEVTPKKTVKNSVKYKDALKSAIRSGKIIFRQGQFKGEFNAHLTKALKSIGAIWDANQASFRLQSSNIPKEIKAEIAASVANFDRTMDKLNKSIEQIVPNISEKNVDMTNIFDKEIFEVDNDIKKRVEKFSVYPTISEEQRKNIAEQYNENMNLYIKDFVEKEIVELREGVNNFIQQGARPEQMRKYFMSRYGVSKSKAKFLARQESNLLVTQLQKEQYTKAGIDKYIWRTARGSTASPVRATHAVHDGKEYSWNQPPLVGDKHLHPGQDFNCRCVAIPVVEF